jgi:hypothetical protein
VAADLAAGIGIGVLRAGLGAGFLDAVGIALGIAELQRILAHRRGGDQGVDAAVEQLVEARLRADAAMMLALRADRQVRLIFLGEHHLLAGRAFVPQIVRRIALGDERDLLADAVEPAHAAFSVAALRTAALRVEIKSRTGPAAAAPCSPISSTIAEPTTTPSATRPIASACSGPRTPKPTATGRSVPALKRATAAGLLHAGDPGDRDIIEEARGAIEHRGQPLLVGGGGRQADQVDARRAQRRAQRGIGLGRDVDADHPVDPGLGGFGREP